ncbi:MAG: hypothetical protein WCP12_17475 [bacterium]
MKNFNYTARDRAGATKRGSLKAIDRNAALHELAAQGMVTLSITEGVAKKASGFSNMKPFMIAGGIAAVLVGVFVAFYLLSKNSDGKANNKPKKAQGVQQTVRKTQPKAGTNLNPKPSKSDPGNTGVKAPATLPAPVTSAVKPVVAGDAPPIRGAQQRLADAIKAGERITPLFNRESENILSLYTKPGLGVVPHPLPDDFDEDMRKALKENIVITDKDTPAEEQEKELVAWLKDDVRKYLENGGTATDYIAKMTQKHDADEKVYSEARNLLSEYIQKGNSDEALAAHTALNEELKSRGIVPMPLPGRLRRELMNKK